MHECSLADDLRETGYRVLSVDNVDTFFCLCNELGQIIQKSDVKIDSTSSSYIATSDYVPFHTDNPKVDVVSWMCIEPGINDGQNLIIDSRKIINSMSASDLNYLIEARVYLPNSKVLHPIITNLTPLKIYYSPVQWKACENLVSRNQLLAMKNFESLLQVFVKNKNFISVELKNNESLFLNNQFMLHGRASIDKNSPRHLVRSYIKSEIM